MTERLGSSEILSIDISIGLAAVAVALVGASFLQGARATAESMGSASLTGKETIVRIERLRFGLLLLLLGGSAAVLAAIVSFVSDLWVLGAVATSAAIAVVVIGLVVGVPLLANPDRGLRLRERR